jgi:hypothetical protein
LANYFSEDKKEVIGMKATSLEIILVPVVGQIKPVAFKEAIERIQSFLKKNKKKGNFEMDFIETGKFFRDEYSVRWFLKEKII